MSFSRAPDCAAIQIAKGRRQPVGEDQALSGQPPGGRKRFIEARVTLLIFESENDREYRSDDCQYRRLYRQKIPVRELKEQGDEQRPQSEGAGFPSRPDQKFGELIAST